jgi:hypothetical protein
MRATASWRSQIPGRGREFCPSLAGTALVGVVSDDNVTLNTGGAVATFASASVGTHVVAISGLTISGVDAPKLLADAAQYDGQHRRLAPDRLLPAGRDPELRTDLVEGAFTLAVRTK